MPEMLTTKEIAAELQYTEQYVNRKVLEYCTAHRISKTYFGRPKPGKGGGRQYTRKEVDKLKAWLNGEDTAASEQPAPEVTVETGNHAVVLANPQLPERLTLESLRDIEVISMDDPLAIADAYIRSADCVLAAIDSDIQAREQRLQQTRQARIAVTQKTQELTLEARFYKERARSVDTATNAETSALQQALETLNKLAKPHE